MRLIKIMIISVIVVILLLTILTFATSRGFSEITDLINKETETFYKQYSFSEPELSNFQINGVLFIPYTNHNPIPNYEQKFHSYSLKLISYKPKANNCKVIVNKVTLEGISNIRFDSITKELNKNLQFVDEEKHENIQVNIMPLIDEINNYDMELTDKSQIKVTINVSVEENGEIITRDLDYIFETKIRKYLNQR